MKRTTFIALLAALTVALLIVSMAAAQSSGGYDLSWSTIADGGETSGGGGYSLGGTIGQADSGSMSSGGYTLVGGFWGGAERLYYVYLPLVLR